MSVTNQLKNGLRKSILAISLVALAGCTTLFNETNVSVTQTGQNNVPNMAVPDGTDPDDAVIGRREHPRIIAAYGGVYSDRNAEIMLARIVSRLLTAADQPNTQFTVTILDSSEVNAFALPGGYVYVTRGILALANDTSELAAVLAHEIAHVTLRHARARTNRTRTVNLVDKVVTGVFGGGQSDQTLANSRQQLAAFSQQQELDADREGINIAGRAGFDPHAASRFLAAMGRFAKFQAGQTADDFLSSHPSTPDRIQKATAFASSTFGATTGESDHNGYLDAISGVTFGDSPQQGAIIGRRFIHPGLKFTFTVPEGYTLQNSQSAVVGVAGDGEAVRFDSAEVSSSLSLADYLKSGWIAGLQANTVTQQTFNGIEMASGIAKTDQWNFRVSVMRVDGQVYRFIFASKSDTARFAQGADSTLKSFRRAEPADLGQIRQVVVKAVAAKAGETADGMARQMAGLTRGVDLFYILNNLYPGDKLVPGRKYKVVMVQ